MPSQSPFFVLLASVSLLAGTGCRCWGWRDITLATVRTDIVEQQLPGAPDLTGVAAIDDGAIAVGGDGYIVVFDQTFRSEVPSLETTTSLNAVRSDGWAEPWVLGGGGAAWILRIGGTAWDPLDIGTSDDLRAVTFPGDGRSGAVVIGDQGLVAVSPDIGVHWTTSTLPGPSLRSVASLASGEVFIVGDEGAAWLSGDRGDTWAELDLGTDANLAAVSAVGAGFLVVTQECTAFLVDPAGRVVSTLDAPCGLQALSGELAGSSDGTVYTFDPSTGGWSWLMRLSGGVHGIATDTYAAYETEGDIIHLHRTMAVGDGGREVESVETVDEVPTGERVCAAVY